MRKPRNSTDLMAGCSQRPRCHKTKKRRCIKPNPWVSYLAQNGGKGLSRDEIMHGYKVWKSATFRRFTSSSKAHVARRQEKLCDLFAPNSRPAPRRVSRVALPQRRRPKAAAPTVNKQTNNRGKQDKAREKRRVEREKEQADERRKKASAEKKRERDEAAARRASAEKKRERDKAAARRASAEKKRERDKTAARLREVASGRNDARLARRAAANKKKEQSAARRASAEKKRAKASEERRRGLKGKGKAKAKPDQREKSATAGQRKEMDALKELLCKDSFKSPVLELLSEPSRKKEPLYGERNRTHPSSPLQAYRFDPPDDGTCMWASIAAGLLGSPGQLNMIKRDGESLCDRLMTWLQQHKSPRRASDYVSFVKWIVLNQLRKMPLSDKEDLLNSYNLEDGEKVDVADVGHGKKWATKKEAYDKIEELYNKDVKKKGFWATEAEIQLLSEALYPLVGLAVFAPPEKSPLRLRSQERTVQQPATGNTVAGLTLQRGVYSDPKPASLLLLRFTRGDHYELLSLNKTKKDFLVLEGEVPNYLFRQKSSS